MEGEIPAAVLNEKLVDETNKDKSALEIEVKLDDGSTAVIYTEWLKRMAVVVCIKRSIIVQSHLLGN